MLLLPVLLLLAAAGARADVRVQAHGADPLVRLAAAEIAKYARAVAGPPAPAAPVVHVGTRDALAAALGAQPPLPAHADAHRVASLGPGRVVCAGASPRAALYAAYTFVERVYGQLNGENNKAERGGGCMAGGKQGRWRR